MGNRRLALIPARSGSKGVPRKNIRMVAGQSLLARAIKTALASGLFDRVFVSTDSDDYVKEAADAGVETPFLRPPGLAGDKSVVADTIEHTINTFAAQGELFDTLTLLEPTSPLRTTEIIRTVTLSAEADGWDAAFTVSPVPISCHPLKQFNRKDDGELVFFSRDAHPNVNRQQLATTYVRNGLCYAVQVPAFLKTHSIHGTRAKGCIAEGPAISIDTVDDLDRVRQLLEP